MKSELQSILDDLDQLCTEVLDSEYRPSAEEIDRRLKLVEARLRALDTVLETDTHDDGDGAHPADDHDDALKLLHKAKTPVRRKLR